ncbi:CDP-glucose 4,6-dehydratase [Deltaproteobacteria bacterium]|nr:CDP-glucose 4,6-dehydratase [Deltaproteobacteria bacterium]
MTYLSFYQNKKVLITGHTGFKGSWLSIWLNLLGAEVYGYALEPYTKNDNFLVSGLDKRVSHHIGDIRSFNDLLSIFKRFNPEIVFHLAAQPLVRRSYIDPKETFDTNIGGTVNILECCRLSDSVEVIVNVTSDKCYENYEWPWGYRENDRLGGHDPYSSSKAGSEIVSEAYRKSFFNQEYFNDHGKCLATARAGNVIGGGDWREDRLIPDCIRSLEKGEPILLRNPDSIRPWQHVLEPLYGYLLLAVKMSDDPVKFSSAWNFGPRNDHSLKVEEVADLVVSRWGKGSIELEKKDKDSHEARTLCLDITKAMVELSWEPRWDTGRAVSETVDWYRNYKTSDIYRFCEEQIEQYIQES